MSVNIRQGQQKKFTLHVRLKDGFYDLTNFDEFKVCLPTNNGHLDITETINANGSIVVVTGPPAQGDLEVTLSYLDSVSLKVGERLNIGLLLDNSVTPNPQPLVAEGVLNVKAAIC